MPSLELADKFNAHLGWIGNLKADGRPILGLDAKELAKIVLNISPDAVVVPAHIWTPHFSLFGSESGFDSIKQCFEDYGQYIYAMETGLSSDPAMNWRWSELDNITLISNSDSHSPRRIGREANVFEGRIQGYKQIREALRFGIKAPATLANRLVETVEFFPEEGKYHYDGHRNCKVVMSPEETKKNKGKCPVCGRKMTIGVMNRVVELADRAEGYAPAKAVPYRKMIPLEEIIADAMGVKGVATKAVEQEYKDLINKFGSEFSILMNVSAQDLRAGTKPEIAEGIIRVREGRANIQPGYDGEYGKIKIFEENERGSFSQQVSLF